MKKLQLVLVRHGQSEWNLSNWFTGWVDVPLTKYGEEEARLGGRVLKQGNFRFTKFYTSFLKRAIDSLNIIAEELQQQYLPVKKSWRLNERHYGGLTGLNKKEMTQKYGEENVTLWRRSFNGRPPTHEEIGSTDDLSIFTDELFIPSNLVPKSESLKDTLDRVAPLFYDELIPDILRGERVLVVAHGNSLRALVKGLEGLSEEEIVKVNIPTGLPLVYEMNEKLEVVGKEYLGEPQDIARRINEVKTQYKWLLLRSSSNADPFNVK